MSIDISSIIFPNKTRDIEEPIVNKTEDCNFSLYFELTKQLINLSDYKDKELIQDIVERDKVIGRLFLKNNKSLGYEEIFLNKKQRFLSNLLNNFSFLFPPGERNQTEKIIGVRYYNNDVNDIKSGYFTLIFMKDKIKFEILEKTKNEIKDCKGQTFYNEKINCLKIIENILSKKYRDNNYIANISIIEILGLIYAAKQIEIKNCMILDPFIPYFFKKESTREPANIKKDSTILYLEPIIYYGHISLLLFFFEKNKVRNNILLDMSHFHKEIIMKDLSNFPKAMRKEINIIPKKPIQYGPTCGIWFIGQMYYFLNAGIKTFDNILSREKEKEYCIESIKFIIHFLNADNFIKDSSEESENDYKLKNFKRNCL